MFQVSVSLFRSCQISLSVTYWFIADFFFFSYNLLYRHPAVPSTKERNNAMNDLEQRAHEFALAYSVVRALKNSEDIQCSGDFKKLYDEFYDTFLENFQLE